MAETDRSEAQRRREDARRQRRESQATGADEPQDEPAVDPEDEAHAGLKHAAKVAAAGAAVGAAVGAALAARDGESDEEDGATTVDEPREPAAEQDGAVTEQGPPDEPEEPRAEPTAVEQPEADADAVSEPEPEAAPEPQDERPRQGVPPEETVEVVRRAREQLQALQGRDAESVSSLERTAQGWTVALEVVELPRVPNSTDVMASYELMLDEDKNVISFTRGRRYYRSQADRDGQR